MLWPFAYVRNRYPGVAPTNHNLTRFPANQDFLNEWVYLVCVFEKNIFSFKVYNEAGLSSPVKDRQAGSSKGMNR